MNRIELNVKTGVKKTVQLTQVEIDDAERRTALEVNSAVVSFTDFEERFTSQEWNAATDFVYQTDTVTGKPKQRAMIQGLARAQARNSVDLADNKTAGFLTALVSGLVITASRKNEILKP